MKARFKELKAESQRLLAGFLESEIELGHTFASVAASERASGNLPHCERAKGHGIVAVAAIRRFVTRIENMDTKAAIEKGCDELEQALSEV
ncbi:MAG: hypothetical protein ABJF23_04535 [Bryobacteraceae bacterium]